jgi:predicted amidohydrolase
MQATSAYNKVYTVIVNNAASLDNPNFFPDAFGGSGGSAIYGPNGEILAQAKSKFEQGVTARIPIASYRKRHRIPDVHMDLYQPILDAYQPRFAPNLFSEYTPTDLLDAKRYLDTKNRWR